MEVELVMIIGLLASLSLSMIWVVTE